jgi:hypothetical protein
LDSSKIKTIKALPSLFFHGVSQLPLRFKTGNVIKVGEEQYSTV